MAEVTLILKASNQDYVNKMKEAQNASQKVYDTVEKGSTKARGLIEKELQAQKQLSDQRNKAKDIDNLKIYNKLLEDSKNRLDKLQNAGIETEKKTNSLTSSFAKLGTAILAAFSVQKIWEWIKVTAIAYDQQLQAEKKLLNALDGRERIQKRLIEQAKGIQKTTIFKEEDIIAAQAFLAAQGRTEEQIRKTISAAIQLSTVMGTDLQTATEQLSMTYEGTIGRLGRIDGRLKGLTTTQLVNGGAVELLGEKYKGFAETAATVGLGSVKQLDNAWGDLKKTFGEVWSELLRVTGASSKMKEQMEGTNAILQDKNIPLWKRWLSFFGIGTKEVLTEVGVDSKIAAENLVKTDKEKQDEIIAANKKAWETLNALDGVKKQKKALEDLYLKKAWETLMDFRETTRKEEQKSQDEFNDKRFKSEKEHRQADAKKYFDDIDDKQKKQDEKDKYTLDQKKEYLKTFTETISSSISVLDTLAQKEVERTKTERELFDTRISEVENEIQTETQLKTAGIANNLTAKQKELDALKKQRAQALVDEETARRKAHTIALAALVADKAAAIAEIIMNLKVANEKAVKMFPVSFGQPWVAINTVSAIASIAAIAAAVAAAASAKYAKGGWTGDGRYRDETGERMAGIVHEKEFVVRKGPAYKYREVLEAINKDDRSLIVNRFNKLSPELLGGTTINNVVVENEGPNKRLDKVNEQLRQLNRKQVREEVLIIGHTTIIKRGNTTRLIR
jgi:hypothetical protein